MLRTIGTCHCPFFCLVQRIHRVGKGFSVTRDGSQIISVMRDRAQINRVIRHSSVMREISLLLRDTWFSFEISVMVKWLISMETRSRDIKNTKLWDKLLALFSRFSTSDFFRSSDNRMLVNVVNILNYLSVMRDRYPPPPARLVTLSSMSSQRTIFVLCYPLSRETIITFLFLIVNNGLLTLYFFCWIFWPTIQRVVQLRGNLQ